MKSELPQKSKVQGVISVLIIITGLLLLALMIVVEDEPGAVPLLLIVSGTGWFIYAR